MVRELCKTQGFLTFRQGSELGTIYFVQPSFSAHFVKLIRFSMQVNFVIHTIQTPHLLGEYQRVRHWNMSETGENVTEVNVFSKYESFLFERNLV